MYFPVNSLNGIINFIISIVSIIFHTGILILLGYIIYKCANYEKIIKYHEHWKKKEGKDFILNLAQDD